MRVHFNELYSGHELNREEVVVDMAGIVALGASSYDDLESLEEKNKVKYANVSDTLSEQFEEFGTENMKQQAVNPNNDVEYRQLYLF
ncbi:hypothetical protein GOP80_06690 [Planococcaceae bacterium Storch 2/2-2]|nr:hypothetical protein [Planococcaceae bacterium Storch 2/2-2]